MSTRKPASKTRGLVRVYLRPDGRSPYYMFRATDPATGKREAHSTKRTDPNEALDVAEAWLKERLDRVQLGARRASTIGEAVGRYIASKPRRKSNDRLDMLARSMFGEMPNRALILGRNTPLRAVAQADVVRLHATRLREGLSPRSANYEALLLVATWRAARDEGYEVGATDLKAVREKTEVKTHYLSPTDFERLLLRLSPTAPVKARGGGTFLPPPGSALYRQRQDAQDLCIALAYLGGRWSEVARLSWDQIEFGSGVVRLWGYKTGKERGLPLAAVARQMLERRFVDRPARQTLVFAGVDGERVSAPAIARAMTDIGLNTPERVARFGRATIHSLRHTFASWCLQNGITLAELRDLLGHSSIAQTERYAHLIANQTHARAAAALDRITEAA
jgi:integrase